MTANKIANNAITSTQIANSTITSSQIASSTITGGNIANSTIGVANLNASGTASSSTYLRGDGTWSTPSGGSSNTYSTGSLSTGTISSGATTVFYTIADGNTITLPASPVSGQHLILIDPDCSESNSGFTLKANTSQSLFLFTSSGDFIPGTTVTIFCNAELVYSQRQPYVVQRRGFRTMIDHPKRLNCMKTSRLTVGGVSRILSVPGRVRLLSPHYTRSEPFSLSCQVPPGFDARRPRCSYSCRLSRHRLGETSRRHSQKWCHFRATPAPLFMAETRSLSTGIRSLTPSGQLLASTWRGCSLRAWTKTACIFRRHAACIRSAEGVLGPQ